MRLPVEVKLLADDLTERVGDLAMTGNGGLSPVRGVAVDIVSPTMTNQYAPRLFQFLDEGLAFHTSNSTDCCMALAGAGDRSCVTIKS